MKRLLLASQYAFYPLHWDPFAVLCEEYDVAGSVIAPPPPEIPSVHRQLGWVDVEDARNAPFAPDIRLQCRGSRRRQRAGRRDIAAAPAYTITGVTERGGGRSMPTGCRLMPTD